MVTALPPNEQFEAMLARFDPDVRQLARAIRELVHDVLPGVVEVVWERQGSAGFGTGPKKMSEHFAWMMLYPAHVNFGFNYGSELPDPNGILGGSGALMRHIQVRRPDDVRTSGLRELIEASTKHRVPPLHQ